MFFFYHKHIRALRAFVPKNRQRQGFAQTVVSAYRTLARVTSCRTTRRGWERPGRTEWFNYRSGLEVVEPSSIRGVLPRDGSTARTDRGQRGLATGRAQACMYSVSHDRGLIPHDDEDQPAGFIGLMKGRLPVPCDQGLVEADEQWLQPMQALGHRARRQVQPQPPPGLEQPFGRPLGGELVVQDLDPDRGPTAPWGSVRARPAR